jgi:hypothetical protein
MVASACSIRLATEALAKIMGESCHNPRYFMVLVLPG